MSALSHALTQFCDIAGHLSTWSCNVGMQNKPQGTVTVSAEAGRFY